MSIAAALGIFCVVIVESLAVFIGNIFTIFVFWKHRNKLKRTSFLLINLAVADLLVGVTHLNVIGKFTVPRQNLARSIGEGNVLIAFQTTFTFASIFFLVLISLERAYALIWPLRHRVASTKVYIYVVIFLWVAGIFVGTLSMLASHGILNYVQWKVVICSMVVLGLVTICVTYLTIRSKLNCRVPAIDNNVHNRQNVPVQNAKLSRTLFIVIAASLLCWCPSAVGYSIHYLCSECVPYPLTYIFNICYLANSFVNPIIYSFRIPMFRETLKRVKFRKQSKQYRVNYIS